MQLNRVRTSCLLQDIMAANGKQVMKRDANSLGEQLVYMALVSTYQNRLRLA